MLRGQLPRMRTLVFSLGILFPMMIGGIAIWFVSCGGSSNNMQMPGVAAGTGTINVSITDPPVCKFPHGSFLHVYVSIRSVQAHISASADDNTPGWQELVPALKADPMQIDLFAAGPNACLLAMLGSNTSLPVGTYQQIRLLLVANDGGGGPMPMNNACGNQGFNCVVLNDGSIHEIKLSSQANTGLKIPPGQIQGGPITVAAGQSVDLNIDFNACKSLIQQGNGEFRLKPVLTAGQVSTNNTGISGQVVDSATGMPIAGGTVLVALEQQVNMTGPDVIFRETAADSDGNFVFCPLPVGATFDVVVVAINGAGVAYNATVAIGVPGGTKLTTIPLEAESGGASTGPGTIHGFVTATKGAMPASIDAAVSAFQSLSIGGDGMRLVTIPPEGNSTANLSVDSNTTCPVSAPLNTNCAQYTLIEPASNLSVGIFSGGNIYYSPPAAGDVLYTVGANATVPLSGGMPDGMQPNMTTNQDSTGNPLKVTPGGTVTAKELDFTGCS
jgi:Domain of unknown function (DUF4382)